MADQSKRAIIADSLAVADGVPATEDLTGVQAMSYTDLEDLPETYNPPGVTFADNTRNPLNGTGTQHYGGTPDFGSTQLRLVYEEGHAGITLLDTLSQDIDRADRLAVIRRTFPNVGTTARIEYDLVEVAGRRLVRDGGGQIAFVEYTVYFRAFPIVKAAT